MFFFNRMKSEKNKENELEIMKNENQRLVEKINKEYGQIENQMNDLINKISYLHESESGRNKKSQERDNLFVTKLLTGLCQLMILVVILLVGLWGTNAFLSINDINIPYVSGKVVKVIILYCSFMILGLTVYCMVDCLRNMVDGLNKFSFTDAEYNENYELEFKKDAGGWLHCKIQNSKIFKNGRNKKHKKITKNQLIRPEKKEWMKLVLLELKWIGIFLVKLLLLAQLSLIILVAVNYIFNEKVSEESYSFWACGFVAFCALLSLEELSKRTMREDYTWTYNLMALMISVISLCIAIYSTTSGCQFVNNLWNLRF